MAKNTQKQTDIEECKDKIKMILREYNCEIISADEYTSVLLRDRDTEECLNIQK